MRPQIFLGLQSLLFFFLWLAYPLLTLSWALANSVAHSPLCLFYAGVITSIKNALPFLKAWGGSRHANRGGCLPFMLFGDVQLKKTQPCLSRLYTQTTGVCARLFVPLVSQWDGFILSSFPRKTRNVIHSVHQIQKYFSIINLVYFSALYFCFLRTSQIKFEYLQMQSLAWLICTVWPVMNWESIQGERMDGFVISDASTSMLISKKEKVSWGSLA